MPTQHLAATEAAVSSLLDEAAERGYLLLSEVEEHRDERAQGPDFVEQVLTLAQDRDIQILDDLSGEDKPESETPMTHSGDSVRQYLDAAGRHDLLTAEDEQNLAKRYQAGLAADRLIEEDEDRELSAKQRAKLRKISRMGKRAKTTMVRTNLRLVVSRAKKWLGRGVDMIELIQEGNLGLIRAVEKFDHTKGYKFSTYAVWWIRQSLQRGVAGKARTIRVPAHIWEKSARLRRAEKELRQRLGRDPTEQELADAVELSVERVREIDEVLRRSRSLDRPVGEDGDATVGDLIPDDAAEDPSMTASADDARSRIERALSDLSEREREILQLRFGFIDGRKHTLGEIGDRFDLSRERVRQMEKQALSKLRHPASRDDLRSLLDAVSAA